MREVSRKMKAVATELKRLRRSVSVNGRSTLTRDFERDNEAKRRVAAADLRCGRLRMGTQYAARVRAARWEAAQAGLSDDDIDCLIKEGRRRRLQTRILLFIFVISLGIIYIYFQSRVLSFFF